MFALAIDLGTTTIAASLVDCGSGERRAISAALNPQRSFGADVISRLDAAVNSPPHRLEMMTLIRTGLSRIGRDLCQTAGISWSDIHTVAIAGNPAMQHILMGLELRQLAFPPYRPLSTAGTHLAAGDLGWEGSAGIYIFPMPGGFVGGDTVAFLFGTEPDEGTLCLDIGTNGELALISGTTVWATSAAAGPAFEGGNLSCGMAALPGAISSVKIEGDRVSLMVRGAVAPVGVCGSGAVEAVSELLRCNVLEEGGRMRSAGEIDSNLAERVIAYGDSDAFVLYRDAERLIVLTQDDIRQLQLAKAAIRAGIEVLSQRAGMPLRCLKQVLLTGSFGSVMRAEWLKTIGIFDKSMVQTTLFIPEGVLAGVEKALLCEDGFSRVEELSRRFRVLPLSGTPVFETHFMRHIDFPR